jgi:hypothetical protein
MMILWSSICTDIVGGSCKANQLKEYVRR